MKNICLLALLGCLSSQVSAQVLFQAEGAIVAQTRNEIAIPADTGTRFDLADWDKGPVTGYRAYLGYKWNSQHELRALYAPLALEIPSSISSARNIVFQGKTFSETKSLEAYYKFNSYRLSYIYHFDPVAGWNFSLGFTGKIRDAEVRLTQGAKVAKKTNVGFVPLLHLGAHKALSDTWSFNLDLDGSAAPQGRAIDLALTVERHIATFGAGHVLSAYTGYRTIEGGADVSEVYSFAWIHQGILGLKAAF